MNRRKWRPWVGIHVLLALAVAITVTPFSSMAPQSASAATPISFVRKSSVFAAPPGDNPTSVTVGPDGRLYVATQSGLIYALTLDSNYNVTATDTITTIFNTPNFNDDGSPAPDVNGRMALGIAFDPTSSPSAPVMYVSHSDPRFGFAYDEPAVAIDTRSGTITRLVGPSFDLASNRTDVVTGLPRSRKNHGTNDIVFGPDGWLYIGQGGNTSLGAPHPIWTDLPERYLSAAIVRANVQNINSPVYVGDVETAADLSAFQGSVELYATGMRNAYDLVWHSSGHLYVNDNGSNPDQGTTPGPEHGCPNGQVHNPSNRPDKLFRVSQGMYGGHPNPSRAECILDDAALYSGGVQPEPHYIPPVHSYDYWGGAVSVNGIAEYPSGAMAGNLISATFSGDKMLRRAVINANGTASVSTMSEVGAFSNPVDVTINGDGVIFVAEYGLSGTAGISVLIPDGLGGTAPALNSVSPTAGSTAGGTSVTLFGNNFAAGANVAFGGLDATSVTVVNSTTITATTPAHSAGSVNVTVTNLDGQFATLSNGFTYTEPGGGTSLLRVNAGGGGYQDGNGDVWSADTGFSGGGTYMRGGGISGTSDDPLYQSERYGNFSYSFDVENGSYLVNLKFAEIYWTSPGQRVFDVAINGQIVLDNFDILNETSPLTALDKSLPVNVTTGNLTVSFTTVTDNAKISAIEIESSGAGDTTPPDVLSTNPSDGAVDVPITSTVSVTFSEPMNKAATEAAFGMTPQPPPGSFSWNTDSTVMTFTPFLAARGFDPDREYTVTVGVGATDLTGNALASPYSWNFTTAGGGTDTTPPVVTAEPPGGSYETAQSVTLSADEPATIYYTTNGTTPTTSSNVYSSSINVSSSTTLKFFAVDTAENASNVVTEEYIITGADTTPPTVTATPPGDTYDTAQSVTLAASEPATIYYTTDGSTPDESSAQYSAPIAIDESTTLKFFGIDTAQNASTVVTEVYVIETAGPAPVIDSITPTSGPTAGGTSVTLSGANFVSGATVTFDGLAATNVTVVNSTTITANTPAHSAGTVSVTVANPDEQTDVLANAFTYEPSGGTSIVWINAGGGGYTDGNGDVWSADNSFSGGGTYVTGSSIAGTTDDALYRTERFGNFSYNIALDNGDYLVTLKFAEIYWTTTGQRIFDVAINGQVVLDNFDILAEGSPFTALDKTFPTTVTNGTLEISFTTIQDNAKLSAIEITSDDSGGGDTTPPTVGATPAGDTYNSAVTVTLSANEPATIYYTTDGSTPTTGSPTYSAPIDIDTSTTLKFFAVDTAGNPSSVVTEDYVIEPADTTPPSATATPAGGTYPTAQSVTLAANEPATIYYTTNGSTPTTSSTIYSSPINVSSSTTLKFFAVDTAGNPSNVVTENYIIEVPDSTPPSVSATPPGGTYSSAQSVTLAANEPATIYYTVDGSTPDESSAQYGNPIAIDETTTLRFFAVDAADNASAVVTEEYVIDVPDPAPSLSSISPTSGPTTGGTGVTLSGSNFASGATVTFGGSSATNVVVVNSTTITANTPAHAAGTVNVTVTNPDNQDATLTNAYSFTDPTSGDSVVRVNAGGGGYQDGNGDVWSADSGFSGGRTYVTGSSIAGTTDDALYRTERYGNFSYSFPVDNGDYLVTLKFAEVYWANTGQRVFDVAINGQIVLDNFDILAETSPLTALDMTLPTTVTNGTLTIEFTTIQDNAKVSAIEITSSGTGGGDTTPPVVSATPPGGTYGSSQSVALSANEPATIYYTTDGSTPTTSSAAYSAPIAIDASTTLKFFAVDTAENASNVVTEEYVISTTDPAPDLQGISPDSGPATGGTNVTLSGTGFASGATVDFDGTPATNVVVVNSNTITATSPAHIAGAVDVTVTNPDNQDDTLSSAFTYVADNEDEGQWTQMPPLPEPRAEVGVVEAGGKIYVIGGGSPSGLSNDVFVFDPATETWSEVAPYPGPALDHIGAASVNGIVYIIGGLTSWPSAAVDTVYAYNPRANTWSQRASLPRDRGAMGVAVLNGLIYTVGGLVDGGSAVGDLAAYNPATDTWTELAPMPTPRDHLTAEAVDGLLFAIGGRPVSINSPVATNQAYNPATNTWENRAPMPTARGGHGSGVLDGKIVIFGGEGNGGSPSGTFGSTEEYDPNTDTWRSLASMITPRHGTNGAVHNNVIYVPAGGMTQGGSSSTVHEAFSIMSDGGTLAHSAISFGFFAFLFSCLYRARRRFSRS